MRDIDDSLLIQLAGDAAFTRGSAYYHEGRVGELHYQGKTITAQVEGSEIYQVTLKHTSKLFEGSCDCPASEGFDFCKHCVATALAYRDNLQRDKQLRKTPSKDRLPTYLMTLKKRELVDLLLAQLKNDPNTRAQLAIKADLAAGKLSVTTLKKQITAATPLNRHLFDYQRVRRYFARLDNAIEGLEPIIPDLPADKALTVIDYAYKRIERALETIDDSGGFRLDVLERLGTLHHNVLASAALSNEQLAGYLYTLFEQPVSDFYPEIPGAYLDILGEEGLGLFFTRIQSEWDALPPLQDEDWEAQSRYLHLRHPLEQLARETGDGEALISLYAKTAHRFYDYLQLSDLCLEFDSPEQALAWRHRAESESKKPFNAREVLENNQINIWLYHKEYSLAVELLWQRFSREPSVGHYRQITAIPSQKDDRKNRLQAITLAEASIQSRNEYTRQTAINALVELYLYFEQPEQALSVAETHKLAPNLLIEVALANPDHPERGLPLIFRCVRNSIEKSNNRHYREAIAMLKQAQSLAGEKYQIDFLESLESLLDEYKPKRNFCQWTHEAFSDLL